MFLNSKKNAFPISMGAVNHPHMKRIAGGRLYSAKLRKGHRAFCTVVEDDQLPKVLITKDQAEKLTVVPVGVEKIQVKHGVVKRWALRGAQYFIDLALMKLAAKETAPAEATA